MEVEKRDDMERDVERERLVASSKQKRNDVGNSV